MIQILDFCEGAMGTVTGAVDTILTIIRWAIPIVLIILGSIDMFKAMASSDDKKAGEAKKTFIRRLIYAVVAFLIPFLVSLAFNIVASIVTGDGTDIHNKNLSDGNFWVCWYKDSKSDDVTYDNKDDDEMCNCYLCYGDENCIYDYVDVDTCISDHGKCK